MNAPRRRTPALLTLAFVGLLAATSFWALEVARRSGEDTAVTISRGAPDYYVEQFNFVKIAANGKTDYAISGEKLIHHPRDNSSTIIRPFFKSYTEPESPLTLHAQRATINSDRSQLHLYEAVKMDKPRPRNGEALSVESEHMLVLPNTDIIKTPTPVVIKLGGTSLAGTGIIIDNHQHQLTLHSRVSGHYPSPAKP